MCVSGWVMGGITVTIDAAGGWGGGRGTGVHGFFSSEASYCDPCHREFWLCVVVLKGLGFRSRVYREGPPSYITIFRSPITTTYGSYHNSYPNL